MRGMPGRSGAPEPRAKQGRFGFAASGLDLVEAPWNVMRDARSAVVTAPSPFF
jgi:hypothetical protein